MVQDVVCIVVQCIFITLHSYTHTEYDIDNSCTIDSSISQLNINNSNNDYIPDFDINKVNIEYNPENRQPDQIPISRPALTLLPRLNQYQWNQLSITSRSTWNLLDDSYNTIFISTPSFVTPNNNKQGCYPRGKK